MFSPSRLVSSAPHLSSEFRLSPSTLTVSLSAALAPAGPVCCSPAVLAIAHVTLFQSQRPPRSTPSFTLATPGSFLTFLTDYSIHPHFHLRLKTYPGIQRLFLFACLFLLPWFSGDLSYLTPEWFHSFSLSTLVILHIALKALLLKNKSSHIPSVLKNLYWSPFTLVILSFPVLSSTITHFQCWFSPLLILHWLGVIVCWGSGKNCVFISEMTYQTFSS